MEFCLREEENSMSRQEENTSIIGQLREKSSDVRLQNLVKVFPSPEGTGDFTAVDHVSLTIRDGEMVTLLGPSGCGKTTTLRMISGFEYPTSGEIIIGGTNVAQIPPNKRGISMVFQSYALFPHMTIRENVAYGLRVQKLSRAEMDSRTDRVMQLMQLDGMENRFPNQLSGGQQQRVALARAVVIEPRVLLFDEPLSNLDAKLREHMRDELRALQKRLHITSLYVTHDQSEAMAISDRVVIMNQGVIAQVGTPKEIYDYPVSPFVANFIGKANFIDAEWLGTDQGDAVVKLDGHTLAFPNPGTSVPKAKGGKCLLVVRPEAFTLNTKEGIPCRIIRATYFGSKMEYVARMHNGKTLFIESWLPQVSGEFEEGKDVFAKPNPDCVRIMSWEEVPETELAFVNEDME